MIHLRFIRLGEIIIETLLVEYNHIGSEYDDISLVGAVSKHPRIDALVLNICGMLM